jgi:hypothetical protein
MQIVNWRVVATFIVWLVSTGIAQGQESLSVTLLPGSTGFTLMSNAASNAGSLPISVVTTWIALSPTRTAVSVYAHFNSSTAALAHTAASNTVDIPSSRIEVSINGGAYQPFNQTLPFGSASAGRQLFTQAITPVLLTGARTDVLAFNINLSGHALPADTYVGVLRVRARATP